MDIVLLCDQGCEKYAVDEAKRIINKKASSGLGYVKIKDCSIDKVALLNYRTQLGHRVLALITEGEIERPEDTLNGKETILGFDYAQFLKEDGTFRVSCERHGEHDFQAQEVEEALGALLHDEKRFTVQLDDPSMDVWCKVNDKRFVLGVDLTGRDLGKREYRVFHTRRSLRATIAAAALSDAGYSGKEVLVDPFCIDGVVPIEAALLTTGVPVQKFKKEFSFMRMPLAGGKDWEAFFEAEDKKATEETKVTGFTPQVRTLKMARSNAKLAGVEKLLTLTKCEVSWLDTKFDKESVDILVALPPTSGKNTPLKDVEKLQDDLFYQCRYVLKPTSQVLLIAEKKAEFLNAATRHKFELVEEKEVHMGGSTLMFLKFGKKDV